MNKPQSYNTYHGVYHRTIEVLKVKPGVFYAKLLLLYLGPWVVYTRISDSVDFIWDFPIVILSVVGKPIHFGDS